MASDHFCKNAKILPSDLCTEKNLKAVSTKGLTGYPWVIFFCVQVIFIMKMKEKIWKQYQAIKTMVQ